MRTKIMRTDVRFCWRPSGTNNQCTVWKAVWQPLER